MDDVKAAFERMEVNNYTRDNKGEDYSERMPNMDMSTTPQSDNAETRYH